MKHTECSEMMSLLLATPRLLYAPLKDPRRYGLPSVERSTAGTYEGGTNYYSLGIKAPPYTRPIQSNDSLVRTRMAGTSSMMTRLSKLRTDTGHSLP